MFNPSLYAGTEDLGLNEEGSQGTLDQVAETVSEIRAEVAEANAEIQEQGEVLEEVSEQVCDIQEATEEVQDLVEGMESMLASGNFDGRAFASLYNQAFKITDRRLGGAPETAAPRMGAEDLYDVSTASSLARDGMEGFMDKVKGAGAAVIAFIKKIFNTVVNFFIGLFNKNKAMKRRIEGLQADLSKDGLKLKEKVKLGGWNGYVDYEAKGLSGKAGELAEVSAPLGAYANLLDGEITLAEFSSAYKTLVSGLKSKIAAAGASKEEKGSLVAQIAGIRVVLHTGEGEASDLKKAAAIARGLSMKTVKADNFSKLTSGEAAPKLTNAGALKTVLTGISGQISKLENGKVDQKFAAAKRDKLIGYINASASKDDKETGDKVALVKAVAASSAALTRSATSLASNVLEALIDGVAAHI